MKKVMLAFCLLFGGLVVYAQDTTSTDQTQTQQQYPTSNMQDEQDREKINSRDLPDAVKRSLEATQYRGWLISTAYKTKGVSMSGDQNSTSDTTGVSGSTSDSTSTSSNTGVAGNTGAMGEEVYVVELKNGAQTKTVRFDKEGKELDGQGTSSDQK